MQKAFFVRCYARQVGIVDDGQWVAVCIDLNLAVQGDSLHDVKQRLDSQIADYVHEALTVDRAHARALLTRRAPLRNRLEYHAIRLLQRVARMIVPVAKAMREHMAAFNEPAPVFA